MKTVKDMLKEQLVLSFEVFPPKRDDGMERLCGTGGALSKLYELNPGYLSCTYGAGGTNVGRNLEVLIKIKRDGRTIPVTHFTCIRSSRERLVEKLSIYLDNGIDHVLALRGDIPVGWDGTGGDLHHASELVELIRAKFGDKFCVAVGGFPEGHIESRNFEEDIYYLKHKQDCGADYIMTQLCWDMEQFKRWLDAIRKAGITLPVDVGIMPVLGAASTVNMALSRNGCVIPRELAAMISRHWIFPNVFAPEEDEETIKAKKAAFREEGIEYTVRQIEEFRSLGIGGIHLYCLNRSEAVTRIVTEAGLVG